MHREPGVRVRKTELDGDLCTRGAALHQVVWQTGLWLKGQHFFHCNICASTSMCPATASLSETVSRLGWDGRGRRREGDSRPRDERSDPKQTQISSALLRRQGAEHRVLLDATKPFKTTLQPGMYAPPSSLSHSSCHWHSVYIDIKPWRP